MSVADTSSQSTVSKPSSSGAGSRILGALQSLGRSLMLPVAVLPVAALLLRLGQADLWQALLHNPNATGAPFIADAGNAIFSNLPMIFGVEVAGIVDPQSNASTGTIDDPRWDSVDVAIDFSSPNAVVHNVPSLSRRRINVVLGTTGWQAHEAELRKAATDAGSGVVAAPNFSTGVVLFESIVRHAAKLMAPQESFGA